MRRSQFLNLYISFVVQYCEVATKTSTHSIAIAINYLSPFIAAFSIIYRFKGQVIRMATASPKVIIIGCGVAGPILVLLLKCKAYSPIVLEKVRELGDAGSGLMLFPNGLKVLGLLNLASPIKTITPNLQALIDISYTGTEIGGTDLPSTFKEKYGQPVCGVKRSVLNLALKSALEDAGIPLLEGWKLSQVTESENSVTATSSDDEQRLVAS
jgi:salicylate hydroxylase